MSTSWKVCLDDTCDEKRQDYICAGSLIGTRDGWSKFNKEWRKALKSPPSIDYFHGKEVSKAGGPGPKRDSILLRVPPVPRPWGPGVDQTSRPRSHRVDKLQSGKVLLVIGDEDAVIGFGQAAPVRSGKASHSFVDGQSRVTSRFTSKAAASGGDCAFHGSRQSAKCVRLQPGKTGYKESAALPPAFDPGRQQKTEEENPRCAGPCLRPPARTALRDECRCRHTTARRRRTPISLHPTK